MNITVKEVPLSELKWRCRRGMLELDVCLNKFIQHGYKSMNLDNKNDFYRLLEFPDQELYEILMGQVSATDSKLHAIVERIRSCASL